MKIDDLNVFQSISIDTRTLKAGDVFLALRGENFDGHDFVAQAEKKGAIAAIVSRDVASNIPLIRVQNTLHTLGEMAATRRREFNLPVVGVTGSCGKTTTKTLLASVFSTCGATLATEGNLNNEIGVPLTLLRLTAEYQFAVIEMGASSIGEIAYSANIAKPNVAVLTNAAPAHLQGFGSLDNIAQAKGEIFQSLQKDGIAIINADDKYADYWRKIAKGRRIITFGLHTKAEITAKYIRFHPHGNPLFSLQLPNEEIPVVLSLPGEHNVMNALASAAVAYAINIAAENIKKGLENTRPVKMRWVIQAGCNGAKIIDDTYNANPLSTQAALRVLARSPGERIFVFGDMYELGKDAQRLHQEIGAFARELGIEHLFTFGEISKLTAAAFGINGYNFSTQEELIFAVKERLAKSVTVLVKGSRSAHMENVVSGLMLRS